MAPKYPEDLTTIRVAGGAVRRAAAVYTKIFAFYKIAIRGPCGQRPPIANIETCIKPDHVIGRVSAIATG